MEMDNVMLRTLIHERTHHTIEVLLYNILAGKINTPTNFGETVKTLLKIWETRGNPTDAPDFQWVKRYLDIAEKLRSDEKIRLDTEPPKPFSREEMKTVRKLILERRSIRQWSSKPIPEETLKEILYAGLMAPQGCNVGSTRFIILRNPSSFRLVESDIRVENGVMILICQDMRVYKTVRFDEKVPQNIYYDAAAAADHMLLVAHSFGLGGVWLTHGEATQNKIREHFRLPDTLVSRLHIVIGWPAEAPIKSERMGLEEAIIAEE